MALVASWDILGAFGAAVWVHTALGLGILGYLGSLWGLSWGCPRASGEGLGSVVETCATSKSRSTKIEL